ncbi:TRAP transporter small permease [Inmirania thermothiophila]|uniref:TRAP transporter small permease protein n=1 Tax=Inmirania thermothiophila TaxID=1750597 RepID=A0A3N1Y0T3_9GAMM|nr:TRAP transporter small permease subunit [Inmirania thermothiophila]ROR32444.1 TRAP-type C4-dicarboxylate transport system permease small subunit [Inmirania thermothiophila]
MSTRAPCAPWWPGAREAGESRLLRALAWAEDAVLVLTLGLLVGLGAAAMALRNLGLDGLAWAEPAARQVVLWLVFLGAVVAAREDRHIAIEVLARALPARWEDAGAGFARLFAAAASAAVAWHAARLGWMERGAGGGGAVPLALQDGVMVAAFALIAFHYLLHALGRLRCLVRGRSR